MKQHFLISGFILSISLLCLPFLKADASITDYACTPFDLGTEAALPILDCFETTLSTTNTRAYTEWGMAPAQMQAQSSYVLNSQLHQAFWRNNCGYYRTVPIVSGTIQWGSAASWSAPIPASSLPGSGNMQAQSAYILGGVLHQAFWRNNQGYYRYVPIVSSVVQWGSASTWGGPVHISSLPGTWFMQAQSTYVLNDQLHQAFWRNNQGYYRAVPIVGGVVQWSSAPSWSGPIPASALLGSGNVKAQSNYILGSNFHQAFWREFEGYYRSVPIVGGAIQWGSAPAFSGPIPISVLPSC